MDPDRQTLCKTITDKLTTCLDYSPSEFEQLAATYSEGDRHGSNQLPCHTNLLDEHILRQVVSLPGLHETLKNGCGKPDFTVVPDDRLSELARRINAFARPNQWGSGIADINDTPFSRRIASFYRKQILGPCRTLVTTLDKIEGLDKVNGELMLETTTNTDEQVSALLSHSSRIDNIQHKLAAYLFQSPNVLNEGVWAAFDKIAKRGGYEWVIGVHGGPLPAPLDLVRDESRPDDVDVINEIPSVGESDDFIDGGAPSLRVPQVALPGVPANENLDYHNAHAILQKAWSLSVIHNTTFFVISNGNCERIGVRHRGWGALFLSDSVTLSCLPSYYKANVGFYLTSRLEAEARYEMERNARDKNILYETNADGSHVSMSNLLSDVDRVVLKYEETEMKQTLDRHGDIQHHRLCLQPTDNESRNRTRASGTSPIPARRVIADGKFCCRKAPEGSYFSYSARFEVEGSVKKSNLVLKLAEGTQDCRDLCRYHRLYEALVKIGSVELPQHYGLFQWSGFHNQGLHMVLIFDHPGKRYEPGDAFKNCQGISLKCQLHAIHKAGYLHEGVEAQNIHIGPDGRVVYLLGFQNLKRQNIDAAAAQIEKDEEWKQLLTILGESTPFDMVSHRS